jgi:hypothetical protein
MSTTSAVCAYCHADLDREAAPRCASCGANHHSDCWAENKGCAILGCPASPDGAATAASHTPAAEWAASTPDRPAHATASTTAPVTTAQPLPVVSTGGGNEADDFRAGWLAGYRSGWQDAYRAGWQEGHDFTGPGMSTAAERVDAQRFGQSGSSAVEH